MNIEEAIRILKELKNLYEVESTSHKFRGTLSIPVDDDDAEAIETLLTAYEKEKEKNKEDIKFKRILADNFKRHIESITIGESITFPCGWVYKKDLLDLINDIKWEE